MSSVKTPLHAREGNTLSNEGTPTSISRKGGGHHRKALTSGVKAGLYKKFVAVAMSVILVFGMLPDEVYAAAGDALQGASSSSSATLQEQLEAYTGESYEEAFELLNTLGLVDDDGNLITDYAIELNGVEYTLEEIEEILDDPDTDLTQVAEVDGVSIALADLQSIIALEQEMLYLQETYFSGATFSAEAAENLNDLLAQLQTEGFALTLATGTTDDPVFTEEASTTLDGNPLWYLSASYTEDMREVGDTLTVSFKLAIPDSIQKLGGSITVGFRNGITSDSEWLDSYTVSVAYATSGSNADKEYELIYTYVAEDWEDSSTIYLCVQYQHVSWQSIPSTVDEDNALLYKDYSFGTLSGGVSFYDPEGLLFGIDGETTDYYNLIFSRDLTVTDDAWNYLATTFWEDTNEPFELTVTAAAGTYKSGDLVPITISAVTNSYDNTAYFQISDDATVNINGTDYNLLTDLHASTKGTFISFLYEVQEFDTSDLTVGISSEYVSEITDYFDSTAKELNNVVVADVTLVSPLMKNAVESLEVSYDEDDSTLSFTISAKQDQSWPNVYGNVSDSTGLMQLIITVADNDPVVHTVTMVDGTQMEGEGDFAFTAEDYAVALTAEEQTVVVQLQIKDDDEWVTVHRVTQRVTVAAMVSVTGVTIGVANDELEAEDDVYTIALDDETTYQLEATFTPSNATYTSGTWYSTNEEVATISNGENGITAGTIVLKSTVGQVEFYFVADNGTTDESDDIESNHLSFTITAGSKLVFYFPTYSQDSVIQGGKDATIIWITTVKEFYSDSDIKYAVELYSGTDTSVEPVNTWSTVETQHTIEAQYLTVTYPQSIYTVVVSMTIDEETWSDSTTITVVAPPSEVSITADTTTITDSDTLTLSYSISNSSGVVGDVTATISATRMSDDYETAASATGTLSGANASAISGSGTLTFTPYKVSNDALYETYTITLTENTVDGSAEFTPSTDSIVIYVYQDGALSIQVDGEDVSSITLSNESIVSGDLPTDSESILALRQELGLIEYISINSDEYNWSSFRDGIKWVSENSDAVSVNYRQGGLWDNIEDLTYETYLPSTQMAISSTTDTESVTITATHAATGMTASVDVSVETLEDKFYLFQVSPAVETTLIYTNGAGVTREVTTNSEGLLALYEPEGIASDIYLSSGSDSDLYLGTILLSALSSGENDAAKLQLYPLNTITLVPAARVELYLTNPDGTPYVGTVTLRGGVYLGGYYCEEVQMSATGELGSFVLGSEDNTYTTDSDGMLTVYMDATQFDAEEYTGLLTNASLEYWFELRDIDNNKYYPQLVNIQSSMSADRILRTGSAVLSLTAVEDGDENTPFLAAQTIAYAESSDSDLKKQSVLGSTGTIGPNSTYLYSELTTYFMLWGFEDSTGSFSVSMVGESGFVPEGQTESTLPFTYIPVVANTTVLTKETMTESGWLEAATSEGLKANLYLDDSLLMSMTMPFSVSDLSDVALVNEGASAVVLEMQTSFVDGASNENNDYSLSGDNTSTLTTAFDDDIASMLDDIAGTSTPGFKVIIAPSTDNTVFNVLIYAGYNSLDMEDFDYDEAGLSVDFDYLSVELDVGTPAVNELNDMAKGKYSPSNDLDENSSSLTNDSTDFGAQLSGYYTGQFYYDSTQGEWLFRTTGGGLTVGASVTYTINSNFWVAFVPVTIGLTASIAIQLDFKTMTVYTDQQDEDTISTWSVEYQSAESVNDYLTTLRISGYINAFLGIGFDYSVIALKVGIYGQITGDSTNRFLSRTYLASSSDQQINGQGLGVSGELGLKFVAKFLFFSYEAVIASGTVSWTSTFNDWDEIDDYWYGSSTSTTALTTDFSEASATLLSRDYLAAYAAGTASLRWEAESASDVSFATTASVVQTDANPGSEPTVNDDGSLSVYISDMGSENYFDSRIMAGAVGTEGSAIDDDGSGDMSPSLSGTSNFTVASWVRLFEDLDKEDGEALESTEIQQLLKSTEIMVATTTDGGATWDVQQLTDNATPDIAPVTASNGSDAIVFWRGVYSSQEGEAALIDFDTQNAIYYSSYDADTGEWSVATMVYNGSAGDVAGIQAAMLSDGSSIVVFTIDRGSATEDGDSSGYEIAYRVVSSDGELGDMVVLTSDAETDTNPQVTTASANGTDYFVLGWYTTADDGDIRLQAVGSEGQLYSGGSAYAVPSSVRAITSEDDLMIGADFTFAKRTVGSSIDGLSIVWVESATDDEGETDHSVIYGTQLTTSSSGEIVLSSPQALITLPDRTQANSFAAWQTGDTVNAYIYGTWYDPDNLEEYAEDIYVPVDEDQLLTGGGSFTKQGISVDSIAVDYADLQTNSYTPVVFTIRNTGTSVLTDVVVAVDGYSADAVTVDPGESAIVTVMYKTEDTIENPSYTVTAGSNTLVDETLYLDYNDIGISSMTLVEESEGKRTVQITLYNDSAAQLADSADDRMVALSFYSDSEYSEVAEVTLVGDYGSDVEAYGNMITISGDALSRIDQGSMTLMVSYDLKDYVNNTLELDEVPGSGVYLYATTEVLELDDYSAMAEYATGNNSQALLLTGAYARTGNATSLDISVDNSSGTQTDATVTLTNNSLQDLDGQGTLLAVLLDAEGNVLEYQTAMPDTSLTAEQTKKVNVSFSQLGANVVALYAESGSTLTFELTGISVTQNSFEWSEDAGAYVYTYSGNIPESVIVSFISDAEVTINGTSYGTEGAATISIGEDTETITIRSGETVYVLNLDRSASAGSDGTGSGSTSGASSDSTSGAGSSDGATDSGLGSLLAKTGDDSAVLLIVFSAIAAVALAAIIISIRRLSRRPRKESVRW